MNTLPKKFNRWTLLLVVVVISVLVTFFVTKGKNINGEKQPIVAKPTISVNTGVDTKLVSIPVSVKLTYDYTAGYMDVFITNPSVVEHGELLFKLSGNTRFSKIEENTLFEKYLTSNEVDKTTSARTLRVGATKGIEGMSVKPGGDQKFARIYFSSLKEGAVMLDEVNSTFFVGSGNPSYKVALEK